jgi:hypothetical protein
MALKTSWLIWRYRKIVPAEHLTLGQLLAQPHRYGALVEDFCKLTLPAAISIKGTYYPVPLTLKQFSRHLCYGQRLFLATREPHDIGYALRYLDGYYYPMCTGKPWNEAAALSFGRNVLNCKAKDVFPVAQHLITLMDELITREKKHLFREPSKLEKAAGVERLAPFAALTNLIFLMDSFKLPEAAVMLLPYDDCLVRFMLQKEQQAYSERLMELQNEDSKKSRFK